METMSTETLPLMIDAYICKRFERVAAQAGHNPSALANAVLRDFLDECDEYDAAIQAGIDDAEAGRLISFEEVKANVEAQLAALRAR
jgi:predicted transcriptional regulator